MTTLTTNITGVWMQRKNKMMKKMMKHTAMMLTTAMRMRYSAKMIMMNIAKIQECMTKMMKITKIQECMTKMQE
jgi:hypothetical protein